MTWAVLIATAVLIGWFIVVACFAAKESAAARDIEAQEVTVERSQDYPISWMRPFPKSTRDFLPAFLRNRPDKVFSDANRLTNMEPLRQLKGLRILQLCGDQIVSLSTFASHRGIVKLYLHDTLVTDLRPLQNMTDLHVIDIVDSPVSDISTLAQLPNISRIFLIGTQTNNIQCLRNTVSLREITLQDTKVTDLSPLHQLPLLESVKLSMSTNRSAVEALRAALPNCKIIVTDEQLYHRVPIEN